MQQHSRATMPPTGLASPGGGQRSERPAEDCRDYLRTGRCKYGASCKYNHPPNVQSGGGMKAPIDPSEPLFPMRPNEPLCQYYMKHGTCKFGQACKFHHPPQQTVVTAGGTPSVRYVRADPPRMILNPVGQEGSTMMLQFLPQRPDEPDCIYFLKNGRCKYGATCRYHHPINGSFQHRRHEQTHNRSGRPSPEPFGSHIQMLNGGQITQGIVPDGPVFVSVDGNQTLAPVTIINSNNDPYGPTNTVATESSVSSIGSSLDTTGGSIEYIPVSGDGRALWRARNNGSGGSLNAVMDPGRLPRTRLSGAFSSSEGNIAGRASAEGSPYEARQATRSGSFDRSYREPRSPSLRGRPPPSQRPAGQRVVQPQQRPRQGQGDEAYDRMTHALLNMMETPEETSAEVYSEDGTYRYAIDQDDASRLIEGLTLQAQAERVTLEQHNLEYDDARWSPSWHRHDQSQGQDMIHPYIQPHPSATPNSMRFHQHHASPSSEHSSDFCHYLP
uniref:C3H1-type domain-containing protein n=1 Tax=Amphora coffeiformis TaxID=265554 RepID=A0A7S3P454_9STRA|mmetsp:Transcript_11078/g.21203  ORF Transcript_11078/g.21203 Transcript_11078/m.21203 type:complete len:500 (+) Transcript_11078:302-1801(+)